MQQAAAPSKNGTTQKANTSVAKTEPSQADRFTQEVMKQFTNNAGEVKLTNFQRKLCQNYFIKIDQTLKDLEKKRLAKSEQYRDPLEFKWENVNLAKLAVDVVAWSSIGLDPTQPNHINCIPYKNSATNKFDIGFLPGYKGIEVKAKKYGLDIPDEVVVELVFATDKFSQVKRDLNNKVESYTFEVTDNFNRGELIGGFYYHMFFDKPEKNRLRTFSRADIEKRKPAYASPEFWGGEKEVWEGPQGQRVKKTVHVDGWYEEMAYKTVYRAAYNAITIDSQKIDDHYIAALANEQEVLDGKVLTEIKQNANKGQLLGFDEATEVTDVAHTEVKEQPALPAQTPAATNVPVERQPEPEPLTTGPGF